jgi:acetyl esterase/lipase
VVVFLHGSGGNKSNHEPDALFFNDADYAAVTVEFRPPGVRGYRATLQDAFCSLAWVHAEGENYGLDPTRTVVVGLSFGGRLALTIAAADTPGMFMAECPYPFPEDGFARGFVLWSASIVVPGIDPGLTLNGIAQTFKVDPADYRAWLEALAEVPPQEWLTHTWDDERLAEFVPLLPLAWVNGNEPPILIIHGGRDEAVPVAEAETLAGVLEEVGSEFEYEMIPNMTHVDERYFDDLHALMLDFVQQQLAGDDE